MPVVFYWLSTFVFAIIVTLTLTWSIFYPNHIYSISGPLILLGNQFTSIWTFRLYFYFLFIPIHLTCFLAICWLYSKAGWFGGQLWIISLTFLIADRISTAYWIWHFNKQLPDMWMIWGMISLLFCMTMSAISHK